MIFPVIIK